MFLIRLQQNIRQDLEEQCSGEDSFKGDPTGVWEVVRVASETMKMILLLGM